jgi:uncharacterized membrane protein YqjE
MSGELQRRGTGGERRGGALVPKAPEKPPAAAPQPSTATLLRDAVGDAVDILQAHVQLAMIEVREDAKVAGKVAAGFTAGGALAVLAVGFLGAGAAFGLAIVVPQWAAFAIVGVVIAIAAYFVMARTRERLTTHDFRPEHTVQMLEENRRWLADQNHRRE